MAETLGPPGTGKTTTLLNRVEDELAEGHDPARIAVLTFTRKAAQEAKERALERFGFTDKADTRYWGTIHSIAFRSLRLSRDQMLTEKRLDRLGAELGLEFTDALDEDGRPRQHPAASGDAYLSLHALARARCVPLRQQWQESAGELPYWAVQRFTDALAAYKTRHALYGFEDLLDVAEEPMDVDLVLIDEVQDLSTQQLAYVRRITPETADVGLFGDDDQSIFGWAGADVGFMRRVRADRTVLGRSWRLPRVVKDLADGVVNRCYRRIAKSWQARDESGSVDWVGSVGEVDLLNKRTWLLLARHRHQLPRLVEECRRQGVVYHLAGHGWSNEDDDVRAARSFERLRRGGAVPAADARRVARAVSGMPEPTRLEGDLGWADLAWPAGITTDTDWMAGLDRVGSGSREYIRELRRNGEPLSGSGRVTISTVHGAKGGEADDVFLLTDVTRRVDQAAMTDPDAETRVMYVGLTRARHRLLLCRPATATHWRI